MKNVNIFLSIIAALTILFVASSCTPKNTASTEKIDSLKEQPQVEVKVNRKYDEKGNLILFDSLYTSFYSDLKKDSVFIDSLLRSFDRTFNQYHSPFLDKGFRKLFFTDSLVSPDFFNEDFFIKRYELNDPYIRKMMHDMDSMKNHFYKEESRILREKRSKK